MTKPAKRHLHRSEEPFIITSILSLVGFSVALACNHELLLGFYYGPRMLGLTHLFTLGFATSMVMGVLLRLAPMALGTPAVSHPAALTQFGLYFLGWTGMMTHFFLDEHRAVSWAAVLLVAAAVVQIVNQRQVFAKAWAGDWVATYVATALVYLLAAALLGAGYGLHNYYGIAGWLKRADLSARLSAHLHLAGVGWLTTMILGFQLKLVPTSAGDRRWWPVRFWLLQVGLIGLTVSLLGGLGWEAPFAAILAVPILWHVHGPLRSIRRRRGWFWETVSLALLLLVTAGGLLLALGIPAPTSQLRHAAQLTYAYTGFVGWIVMTVAAVAFKLFPMWVWQERFAADLGRKPTPAVVSLYSDRLRNLTGTLLTAGVLGVASGVLTERARVVQVSLWLVVAGIAAFVINFVRTARWALLPIEYVPDADAAARFAARREYQGEGGEGPHLNRNDR